MSIPVESVKNAIWAVKARSHMMHVLPEKKFVPSLCGMVPPGRGMTPGSWFIVKEEVALKVIEGNEKTIHSLCPKCLKKLQGGAA